jgi:hypothetical protein
MLVICVGGLLAVTNVRDRDDDFADDRAAKVTTKRDPFDNIHSSLFAFIKRPVTKEAAIATIKRKRLSQHISIDLNHIEQ